MQTIAIGEVQVGERAKIHVSFSTMKSVFHRHIIQYELFHGEDKKMDFQIKYN